MSIAPVSANSKSGYSPMNTNNDIKLLEKQKMQLQEQMQQLGESRLDEKTKQERIKQLQEQIQQIDGEIQQKQAEKLNRNTNREMSATESTAPVSSANADSTGIDPVNITDLLQASASYTKAKLVNYTKGDLQNKKQITKIEIKQDGFTTQYREKNLQRTETKLRSLDEKFGEELHSSRVHVEHANQAESPEADNMSDPNEANEDRKSGSPNREPAEKKGSYPRVDIKV